MAEVGLVFGIVDASAGLILKCASVARTLNDLAGKYKKAELTLKTVIQQVEAVKAAWVRIETWFKEQQNHVGVSTADDELWDRLKMSLECGDLVISALEEDLLPFRDNNDMLGIKQRSRLIWEGNMLCDHQTRLRDQVLTMSLVLQVLKL
ncbi:hypothetical protein P7C71_g2451, partial [Lecanoromycetidae sp. Uapishka_2]